MTALLLLLALSAPAIDDVAATAGPGAALTVSAVVTLSGPGEARVEGDVSGRPVLLVKRVSKAGARLVQFRVDPRKLGIRSPDEPIRFSLSVIAEESAGARAEQAVERVLPVPLAVLFGLGQETAPSQVADFAAAIDAASAADYAADGDRPDLLVHHYVSVGPPLAALGRDFARALKPFVKRTGFSRADVVAYSMGGLVTRSAMAQGAGGLVRKVVFVGTPNEGTPIAYLGVAASGFGVSGPVPGVDPALADLLLDPAATGTLEVFYPTYPWHDPFPVLLEPFLPDPTPKLAALNAIGPVAGVEYHAISYSAGATLETVSAADLTLLLSGALTAEALSAALSQVSDSPGDGVVPLRSVFLRDEPAWSPAIEEHDLGPGTHTALPTDPNVLAAIATILDGI